MDGDDATLVEALADDLLRASFASDGSGRDLLLAHASSPNVRLRVLALRGLARQSLMTGTLWRSSLVDNEVDVRRETLQLFAHDEGRDEAVLAIVTQLLDDEDALVVEGAAFALGEHLYRPAVEKLIAIATGHDDPRCRESAVAALGSIGDDRGRAAILTALTDKPPVRRRAIVALSNFEGPDIEAALDEAVEDRDWQVRAAVTQLRNDED